MTQPESNQLDKLGELSWEVDDKERRERFLLGKLAAHDLLGDLQLDV